MAISGQDASIYIGANKVAEMNGFTLNPTSDDVETTTLDSNGWKEYIQGLKSWTVSCPAGNFKNTDTNGQVALINAFHNGTTVSVEFRVNATIKFAGNAYVKYSITTSTAGKAEITFEFTGTGALTPTLA